MNVLPFLAHTFPYLHDLSTNLIYHRHVTIIHLVTSGTPRHKVYWNAKWSVTKRTMEALRGTPWRKEGTSWRYFGCSLCTFLSIPQGNMRSIIPLLWYIYIWWTHPLYTKVLIQWHGNANSIGETYLWEIHYAGLYLNFLLY